MALRPLQPTSDPYGNLLTLEEAFAAETPPTFGIEIELAIVDRRTGRPRPLYDTVEQALPEPIRRNVHAEFLHSQIEYATRPHTNLADARPELQVFLEAAGGICRAHGAMLAWQSLPPGDGFDPALIRMSDRTRLTLQRHGRRAPNLAMCGMHVHVAVPHAAAIEVCDRLQGFMPMLVALAANSQRAYTPLGPVWSHRAAVWSNDFATTVFPVRFGDWAGFHDHVAHLRKAGIIESQKDLYYWARPTRYGTVECRCCDLPESLEATLALAGLIRVLVVGIQRDPTLRIPNEVLHADLLNAITDGPQAQLTGLDGTRRPAGQLLAELTDRLAAVATELDAVRALRWLAANNARRAAGPLIAPAESPTPLRLHVPAWATLAAGFLAGSTAAFAALGG